MTGLDIIGDVHGQAEELEALLKKLGYELRAGSYRHPQRQTLFLGDLIDRGLHNRRVIALVRAMQETGTAQVIMGNHEYNAICYHTEDPGTDKPLREHNAKNNKQHKSFLAEFGNDPSGLEDVLAWFRTLPLVLETSHYRAVHACWQPERIDRLRQTSASATLTEEQIFRSVQKQTPEYDIVEDLLKGVEEPLPAGSVFYDKDGHQRDRIRVRWWKTSAESYREAAMLDAETLANIPEVPFPEDRLAGYPTHAVPVFFGHYWLSGRPATMSQNAVCLDYSVGKPGGALCCYRFDGEKRLDERKFVRVDRVK